jgi:CheY-like chemotaxis protein
VAHEINNPLTGIRADAEVLQARRGEPDLVQVGVDIAAGVDRCSALVRNMLAFGRQQPILRQPLDLAVVVDRALMLLAYRIKMAEVDLERPAATGGPTVQGDPGQLQQVVHNLVENSLTALEGTALPRTLSIRLQDAEDGARLEVVDSGVGIPPGDRERVFEPFFTTHPAGKGTGLGLAICHGIVHSHGGEMEAVEPASGQGVALRVSLPSSEGESPSPDREKGRAGPSPGFLQPPASPSAGAAPEPAVGQSAGFRLLVVDDEDRIRVAISRLLSDYGHTVTGVGSAAAARDVLGTTPDGFDAILLDLRMPGESGSALYETLSAAQQRRVVFMTGALAFRSADAFLSQFWGRFVEKPFTYRDLLEVLTRVVRGA